MPTLDSLDITSEALINERGYPWKEWEQLRREAPVYWYQRPNYEPFWALTKYEDLAWVAANPHLFTVGQRVQIETPDEIEPFESERVRRAELYGHPVDYHYGLPFMDPPGHLQVRKAIYPSFTAGGLKELEAKLKVLAVQHVAEFTELLDERGHADVAHELSAKLPLAALFDLLGVPEKDWEYLFTLHHQIASAFSSGFKSLEGEDPQAAFMRLIMDLDDYMAQLVRTRMAEGGGDGKDVLSRLANARLNGERLQFHDISYHFTNLVHAGNGTSRNAIVGGVKALLEHPEQLRKLIDDPSLVDSAVEEILRWTSVGIVFARVAKQDLEIRGQLIRKGETVAMVHPSANRDEDVFENPDVFDITRSPNKHLAFGGAGEHRCIGNTLARFELRAMFNALLPLLPTLELNGESRLHVLRMVVAEYAELSVRRKKTTAA
ncbi:cytochrome P450 [Streptomyces sp. NPDC012888]|uniref:cytochrome P450 n=1 Tax=Streptomyces sp. NPDC012888 TaxID=3364855 RepID=UPI0036A01813